MSEYREVATSLAYSAGEIMQAEREGRLRISQKPDRTLVTHVDLAVQDMAIDVISTLYPNHYIDGEERKYGSPDAEHVWTIDPIDGTSDYIDGGDTHGFGLSKRYRNQLELGMFFNPIRQEWFVAMAGLGAFLNEERIQVNNQTFRPGITYDYCHWDGVAPDARILDTQLQGKPLDYGSAIYQACMVAAGKSAFTVFPGSTAHDILPGALIVQEAGGTVTDVHGQPHHWDKPLQGAIFSNGLTHPNILRSLIEQ